jgi:hypothetical protein
MSPLTLELVWTVKAQLVRVDLSPNFGKHY